MEKISECISKKVVSLESGNVVGYILDAVFDDELKENMGFLVVDEESEELYFLSNDKIKAKSHECLIVEYNSDIVPYYFSATNNPIGKPVLDCDGVNLGNVIDVVLQGRSVKKIVTTKCEFTITFLRKSGKDCLIFGKKSKKNSKKVLFSANFSKLPSVIIEKINHGNCDKINNSVTFLGAGYAEKPVRFISSSDMLIGKKISKDIVGYNNELIGRKNEKITKNIIEKAKKHGKFNILMLFSE